MNKERYPNKARVLEIYGGVAADDPSCDKPQMHHIVFRSDGGGNNKANFCPLSPEGHKELYTRVRLMKTSPHKHKRM